MSDTTGLYAPAYLGNLALSLANTVPKPSHLPLQIIQPCRRPSNDLHSPPMMVSICANCKGLQKLRTFDTSIQESESSSVQWVNTTLPSLRRSSSEGCRACALLLQGILLHHDRFAGVKEEDIKIKAHSYQSPDTTQQHLSVALRWNHPDHDCCDDDDHEHDAGYPDLKLEFFADQGMHSQFTFQSKGFVAGVKMQCSGWELVSD